MFPVRLQKAEDVIVRDAVHAPGFGDRLKAAHQNRSLLLQVPSEIDLLIGVAEGSDALRDAHWVGDQVHVLGSMERHCDAAHQADFSGPHSPAVDDHLALDVAVVRGHALHSAFAPAYPGDCNAFENGGSSVFSALGHGLRRLGRKRLAVFGDMDGAHQIVGPHERPHLTGFPDGDRLDLDARGAGKRRYFFEFIHPAFGACHRDAAGLVKPGGLARLGLQLGVEAYAVLDDLDEGVRVAKLGHQTSGVPRRPTCEFTLFQQDHVLAAQFRQVVGNAAPDYPASDYYDLSMMG